MAKTNPAEMIRFIGKAPYGLPVDKEYLVLRQDNEYLEIALDDNATARISIPRKSSKIKWEWVTNSGSAEDKPDKKDRQSLLAYLADRLHIWPTVGNLEGGHTPPKLPEPWLWRAPLHGEDLLAFEKTSVSAIRKEDWILASPKDKAASPEKFCNLESEYHHRAIHAKDVPGYESLREVLAAAYDQAARGKGKERHANDLPFHKQRMQSISHLLRSDAGMAYQVCKKVTEGLDLPTPEARRRELLGAINYIAGILIFWDESEKGARHD